MLDGLDLPKFVIENLRCWCYVKRKGLKNAQIAGFGFSPPRTFYSGRADNVYVDTRYWVRRLSRKARVSAYETTRLSRLLDPDVPGHRFAALQRRGDGRCFSFFARFAFFTFRTFFTFVSLFTFFTFRPFIAFLALFPLLSVFTGDAFFTGFALYTLWTSRELSSGEVARQERAALNLGRCHSTVLELPGPDRVLAELGSREGSSPAEQQEQA